MNTKEIELLKDFLIKAKKKTYASLIKIPTYYSHGGRGHKYSDKDLIYKDCYYGERSFAGQELVIKKNKTIWSMTYSGSVNSEKIRKKCYTFLKKALRNLPKEFPIRGPKKLVNGSWKYENNYKGNLESFEGVETISFEGKEVYKLNYHGGFLE